MMTALRMQWDGAGDGTTMGRRLLLGASVCWLTVQILDHRDCWVHPSVACDLELTKDLAFESPLSSSIAWEQHSHQTRG